MIFQVAIKFRRHRTQFRQIVPWDRRQIMMLVVIAHVQRRSIDWSVITERLLVKIVSVMLLNPASTHRMQADRKEKREHEVKKTRPAAKINCSYIIGHCTCEIDEEPSIPHFDRFQSWGAGQLKKWKQHEPNLLPVPFITYQPRLPMIRQISVILIVALVRVMF